jgi:hypothetical protein
VVVFSGENLLIPYRAGTSALNLTASLRALVPEWTSWGQPQCGPLGGGTYLHTAIRAHFQPNRHRRVITFTDDEAHDTELDLSFVPRIYTFDLAGTGASSQQNGHNGRFIFGGFSDATLSSIPLLEGRGHSTWPWLENPKMERATTSIA